MNNLLIKIFSKSLLVSLALFSQISLASGLLTPSDGSLPALDINEHHVNVVIEDGFVVTRIEQVFYNPNDIDLEAIYSFPLPKEASLGEFAYWIDGQPITGEVVEKHKAEQIYQQEKQAGRDVALSEKDSYKSFDTKVYPIRAKQQVRIQLTYLQVAEVETSIGRYTYPMEEGGVDELKTAFWNYQDKVKHKFSFNLVFRSSYPVEEFRLPKHSQALVQQISADEWTVSFSSEETTAIIEEGSTANNPVATVPAFSLDQDIVVYWRLKSGLPGSIDLVSYKQPGKERGTFMMTVTPGEDLSPITQGRDFIFVLDYSGSMQGKYQSMVEGVRQGLHKLNDQDRFQVVIFSSHAQQLTNGYVQATRENVLHLMQKLEQQQPGNSTNLYNGMEMALKSLDSDRPSAIVLVTDGVTNVGKTEKKAFIKMLEKVDVRLFTFVMGNSANRPLLAGMTKISNGFAIDVSNSDDIVGQLMQATAKLGYEAFHDLDIEISGVKVKDMTPKNINTLYRGQQLVVFGHYYGDGDGEAEVTIKGKVSGDKNRYHTRFNFAQESELHPELERLWAFATIQNIQDKMDYLGTDKDSEQAITDLAIEYGLVTDYTSMLVMREEQFSAHGIDRQNQQRVAKEHAARAKRTSAPVRNNHIDKNTPAFNKSRPSFGGGGGGSTTPWILFVLLLTIAQRALKTKRGKVC
ncbi:VIT and VWA domain-containing protein [Thalassotalea psychrophila]|uniref:VIT and VWA domain-containing protein n=1 Tax=Thalassotalea psychrophila TaxID=3065647 RepID=A0ABY9TU62_9GAMM|nr:VIT and VWA domain-containing protein [Colwelliaceae bacterium SQ149]